MAKILITLPRPFIDQLDDIAENWGWNRSDTIFKLVTIAIEHLDEWSEEEESEEEDEEEDEDEEDDEE